MSNVCCRIKINVNIRRFNYICQLLFGNSCNTSTKCIYGCKIDCNRNYYWRWALLPWNRLVFNKLVASIKFDFVSLFTRITFLRIGYTENLEIGFEGSATSFGQIAQAFYGGLWAYDGW